MNVTSIIRSKCLVVGILCLNFQFFLSGQSIYPPDGNYSVGENYPTIPVETYVDITLPTISLDTLATLSAWELNSSTLLRPQKASLVLGIVKHSPTLLTITKKALTPLPGKP